jgi:hypothetical protein
MTDTAIALHGLRVIDPSAGILVHAPAPATDTLIEIRRLLDDKRLTWAIWPTGRPSPLNP